MRMAVMAGALVAILAAAAAPASAAAPTTMPANSASAQDDWWKRAVIYELYPRSFADSNNDGIGDLKGIASHLDYLSDLGVDAIWMTPMFPSPQADFGYDVADYDDVDPQFGTIADADALIAKGKGRGIKIILDFVINHTSDKHAWFQQSRSSKTNPYRDFYIWRDGRNGGPPNNWTSLFGGPAWQKDPATDQYYYHYFYPQQPDLNWRNPKVEKAMFDAAEWWLKRGAYGYRLDAVDTMFERADLKDNPPLPGTDAYGLPNQQRINNTALPEVHEALQRLRQKVIDRYPGRILIGETYTANAADLVKYYGARNDEVQLPMFLNLLTLKTLSAAELRPRIEAVENNPVGGWPCFALNNHDQRRVPSRYDLPAGASGDDMARITAALLLTLRGTPILYYGEELGMQNQDPKRVEDVQDIIGKKGWPKEKGRDGERTPMQWDASVNAGFNTGAKPWLPVGSDYATRNVAAERADPNSVLNFYRALIAERRGNPALAGDMAMIDRSNPNVLSYVRSGGGRKVLTMLNFGSTASDLTPSRLGSGKPGRVIVQNRASVSAAAIHLAPLGLIVVELN